MWLSPTAIVCVADRQVRPIPQKTSCAKARGRCCNRRRENHLWRCLDDIVQVRVQVHMRRGARGGQCRDSDTVSSYMIPRVAIVKCVDGS